MTTAAVLREMIQRREVELSALRDALEVIEAVDAQCGDVPASDPVEKINTAPDAGLYGEDGHVPLRPSMPREQRAEVMARHQAETAARNDDLVIEAIREIGAQASVAAIAARTGIAATSLKRIFGRLKDARRLDIVGWARGRRYVLLDDSGNPVPLADRVVPPAAADTRPAPPRESPAKPEPATVSTRPAAASDSVPAAAKPKPVARPPIPYVPTVSDAERRRREQDEIDRFLAERGARKFESGLLLTMLEQAFEEDEIAFEAVYGQKESKGGRYPYRLAGKLVTADHAIRHADVIRRRMGLPPIAAETMEAAE